MPNLERIKMINNVIEGDDELRKQIRELTSQYGSVSVFDLLIEVDGRSRAEYLLTVEDVADYLRQVTGEFLLKDTIHNQNIDHCLTEKSGVIIPRKNCHRCG